MFSAFKAGTVHLITIVLYRPIEDISVPVNLVVETLQAKGMKQQFFCYFDTLIPAYWHLFVFCYTQNKMFFPRGSLILSVYNT